MKLDFSYESEGYHQYCFTCHAEAVDRIFKEDKTYYKCSACNQVNERSIVVDPKVKWWVDDTKEYHHESAGIFVIEPSGKVLFFERNIFPFALTVPSGHVDTNEEPLAAAVRELEEEIGIKINPDDLQHVATEDIVGDSCRRGADVHRWHAYLLKLKSIPPIKVKEEGGSPTWLSLDKVGRKNLIVPVQYIINGYHDVLEF